MAHFERISALEALQNRARHDALLVCAYQEPEKWHDHRIAGAIPLAELQVQLGEISSNREICFYCA